MSTQPQLRFGFGRKLPIVLQAEAAECGLACLAMIAGYFGHHTDLRSLRSQFSHSLKGVDLHRVMEMAARLGMRGRPLKLELEEIAQLRMPCVLHWDMDHFVVLKSAGRGRIVIHDPRVGLVELSTKEASDHFTGVALELVPVIGFKTQAPPPAVSIGQLTGPLVGLPAAVIRILLLSLSLQVFALLGPFYLQWVIDQVLVTGDSELLSVLAMGFAFVLVFQAGITAVRSWSVTSLSTSVGVQWMTNVFHHLLRLPLEFFEKRALGDVTSRLGSLQSIQRTLSTTFVETILDGMMAVVTFALMLVYSWRLALVTTMAVVAYLLLRLVAFELLRKLSERQMVSLARQNSFLFESVRGVQSLKLGCREDVRGSQFHNMMVDTANCDLYLARLNLSFSIGSQLVFGFERIAVIWLGTVFALQNQFSVGMLIAYLAYKELFSQRMNSLIDKFVEFRMLRLHGERLGDIVLTPPESEAQQDRDLPSLCQPGLEVKGLSFRYSDADALVLDNCSFTVKPGEAVAIVGASGCGKTTLVKAMLGLLRAQSGTIELGGQDISRFRPASYRAMIGSVMQDDQLFAGSVADNICFGDVRPDQNRIEEVARMAAIHDEISAMPMGYVSLVGDMGSTLSGGQKQRVILARALYRNPAILFLDEATSHLDIDCERRVNEAIRGLRITKVIIAHRAETIASADRVLVMNGGRIVSSCPAAPADVPPSLHGVTPTESSITV